MPSISAILVIAIATAGSALAQSTSSPILSCLDLRCPNRTGPGACTLAEKSFYTVGNTKILSTSTALEGLSWTEGASLSDTKTGRTFEKSFYLGTPPTLNLTGTGGCAIFFTEVSKSVAYKFPPADEVSQGTCEDVISKECMLALAKRAQAVEIEGLGNASVCQSIQRALADTVDPACIPYTTSDKWSGLSAKELTGPAANQPIDFFQNASTNCWPVEPKDHDLTLMNVISNPGNQLIGAIMKEFHGIVPILTFFYPGNGTLITKSEAHLTCLKTISMDVESNATMSSGQDNASSPRIFSPSTASLAVILAAFGFALL